MRRRLPKVRPSEERSASGAPEEGASASSGGPRLEATREYELSARLIAPSLRRRLLRTVGLSWIQAGGGPWLEPGKGELLLGDVDLAPGVQLRCGPGGRLVVGDGCRLHPDVLVYAAREIVIGKGVHVAWDVLITDTRGPTGLAGVPVRIGDGVWIGAGALVLGGADIGAGAVIGAGLVVAGRVEPGAVLVTRPRV